MGIRGGIAPWLESELTPNKRKNFSQELYEKKFYFKKMINQNGVA